MKVKISYTEDSERVPRLIDQLLSKCRKRLLRYSDLEYNLNQISKFIEETNEAIDGLDLVSDQLRDCVDLSLGYMRLQESVAAQDDESPLTSEILDEEPSAQDETN
jgi:hypothetical protein